MQTPRRSILVANEDEWGGGGGGTAATDSSDGNTTSTGSTTDTKPVTDTDTVTSTDAVNNRSAVLRSAAAGNSKKWNDSEWQSSQPLADALKEFAKKYLTLYEQKLIKSAPQNSTVIIRFRFYDNTFDNSGHENYTEYSKVLRNGNPEEPIWVYGVEEHGATSGSGQYFGGSTEGKWETYEPLKRDYIPRLPYSQTLQLPTKVRSTTPLLLNIYQVRSPIIRGIIPMNLANSISYVSTRMTQEMLEYLTEMYNNNKTEKINSIEVIVDVGINMEGDLDNISPSGYESFDKKTGRISRKLNVNFAPFKNNNTALFNIMSQIDEIVNFLKMAFKNVKIFKTINRRKSNKGIIFSFNFD